jgi:L-aminopeptidase/D-esterase-like protein
MLVAVPGVKVGHYTLKERPTGCTVFALATGQWNGRADVTVVGALAADVPAEAIVRAVKQATAAAGIPAARDLGTRRSPQP